MKRVHQAERSFVQSKLTPQKEAPSSSEGKSEIDEVHELPATFVSKKALMNVKENNSAFGSDDQNF